MEMRALWEVWKERPDPVRGDMVSDFDDYHPDNAGHRKLHISSCAQSCQHKGSPGGGTLDAGDF